MVLETLQKIDRNLPLGAPKKNLATGNPYLDQLKEIDAEIKRLNKLASEALDGSANRGRDLKILNIKLRRSGDLNRNLLGINRSFWKKRGIIEQIQAYDKRKKQLIKFLGTPNIGVGAQNIPKIKGFTPLQERDTATSSLNMYYMEFFDPKLNAEWDKEYEQAKQDYMRGTDVRGMSAEQIDKAVRRSLPTSNKYNPNSKYNPNKFTEYGEVKSVKQNDNKKTELVVDNNNDFQTSTGSYSVKNKNRNKLITTGRDEWIERTKNSPAASFLEPEERWQQQLKHREWLRINNRI